jgi:uncharacterized membrane protein
MGAFYFWEKKWGNTRTLAWLAQVEVAARKDAAIECLRISACQILFS